MSDILSNLFSNGKNLFEDLAEEKNIANFERGVAAATGLFITAKTAKALKNKNQDNKSKR